MILFFWTGIITYICFMNKATFNISKNLIWDIDPKAFDPDRSVRIVVERVFSLGTIADLQELMRYYTKKQVVEAITDVSYLDKKTLNFASWYLNLPKKMFKCYKRKQSVQALWS